MYEKTARPPRPTINDVAALAGVSKGAVSRALNGGRGISATTIARIRSAAVELNWSPSSAARAVSGGPARAIGLVLRRPPQLLENDQFFPSFLAGVESVLSVSGYSAVIRFVSDANAERESYSQLFGERRVDGFLLTDLHPRDQRFKWLTEAHAPVIIAGSPGKGCAFPSVDTGSAHEVQALVQHLIDLGHTNIAHVSGPQNLLHARRRKQVWQETIREAGLTPGISIDGEFSTDGAVRATRVILDETERPTAIFYASDVMAIAGMSVLTEAGIRIPHDVAVAGVDDVTLASYVTPALTTVHCDYQRMGRVSTQMLLAQLRGEEVPHIADRIGAQLRIRASTVG